MSPQTCSIVRTRKHLPRCPASVPVLSASTSIESPLNISTSSPGRPRNGQGFEGRGHCRGAATCEDVRHIRLRGHRPSPHDIRLGTQVRLCSVLSRGAERTPNGPCRLAGSVPSECVSSRSSCAPRTTSESSASPAQRACREKHTPHAALRTAWLVVANPDRRADGGQEPSRALVSRDERAQLRRGQGCR